MHGHLVAVKVRVESLADHGVNLDGLAFDQHGLEGLKTQAVQSWSAVQKHIVILRDLFQNVVHLGPLLLDEAVGRAHIVRELAADELADDKRFEKLKGHALRQSALVELQFRPHDNHGPARIIHALAQKVLPETALLAFEHVSERAQFPALARGGRHFFAVADGVVDEGVHGLLQHAFFIAGDDLGGVDFQKPLQAVVAVDDAAVEVVEVRCRETAAVELDHGPQIGRDHRQLGYEHPFRPQPGLQKRLCELEALDDLAAARPLHVQKLGLQVADELLEVNLPHEFHDGLGADPGLEHRPIFER